MTLQKRALVTLSSLLFSGLAFAAGGHGHSHEQAPQHGGIVLEEQDLNFELVAKPELLQLYLSDPHGGPISLHNQNAKLTLLASGVRQEVELQPAGDHFEAKGSFTLPSQTKVIVVLTGAKVATARFVLP